MLIFSLNHEEGAKSVKIMSDVLVTGFRRSAQYIRPYIMAVFPDVWHGFTLSLAEKSLKPAPSQGRR